MNKDTLWEGMAHLAPDLIEAADAPAAPRHRGTRGKTLLIAAAACLILAVGVVAADTLFGFRILEVINSEADNRYYLQAEEGVLFPVSQFGETVQDYIENGMPVLETRPADMGEGDVITYDVPSFDTWAEAAEFIGEDIPLAEENSVLAEGYDKEFQVFVNPDNVTLSATYYLDFNHISLFAHINTDAGHGRYTTGAYQGPGDMTIQQLEMTTGSGDGALVYLTTGERSSCDAYFLHDGIYYNIFISYRVTEADTALMEEILSSF